jgi:hypothetical protein
LSDFSESKLTNKLITVPACHAFHPESDHLDGFQASAHHQTSIRFLKLHMAIPGSDWSQHGMVGMKNSTK